MGTHINVLLHLCSTVALKLSSSVLLIYTQLHNMLIKKRGTTPKMFYTLSAKVKE